MRFIVTTFASLALIAGMALYAQESEDAEADDDDRRPDPAATFAPTEEVAADTAVAFPTDI